MRIETHNLIPIQKVGGVTITEHSSKQVSPKVEQQSSEQKSLFDLYGEHRYVDPGTAVAKESPVSPFIMEN